MRRHVGVPVALLVARLVWIAGCRAPEAVTPIESADVEWAAEAIPWIRDFRSLVDRQGGLGAVPFLADDVVVDIRTPTGSSGHHEGVDAAVAVFAANASPSGEARWSFDDVGFLDANGAVIGASYLGTDPTAESPAPPRHAVLFLDVGGQGIERFRMLPSTDWWRDVGRVDDAEVSEAAEEVVDRWIAAWSGEDRQDVQDLYSPEAHVVDDVAGIDLRGPDATARQFEVLPSVAWALRDTDGGTAVHLRPPNGDDGALGVLALVRGLSDEDPGCPGELALWLEVDDSGFITRERRLWSVPDARRCTPVEQLPNGWWSGRLVDHEGAGWIDEDLDAVTHRIIQEGTSIEIRNGTPVLTALVGWALSRFDLAGLPLPQPRSITFTSYADYCNDLAGRVVKVPGEDPSIGDDDVYLDDVGTRPAPRVRYAVLHELAHIWVDQHVDPEVCDHFVEWLELPTWNDHEYDWRERGFEHAASFVGWGLMDVQLALFELDRPPVDRCVSGFEMLTGHRPLQDGTSDDLWSFRIVDVPDDDPSDGADLLADLLRAPD